MKVLTNETNPHPFQAKLTSSNPIFNSKNPLNDSIHPCHRSTDVSAPFDIVRPYFQLQESAQRQYTSMPSIHCRFSTPYLFLSLCFCICMYLWIPWYPSWILFSEFFTSFGFSPFYGHPLLPSLEGRAADTIHILLRLGSLSVAVK